jgi:hypothetical protein
VSKRATLAMKLFEHPHLHPNLVTQAFAVVLKEVEKVQKEQR